MGRSRACGFRPDVRYVIAGRLKPCAKGLTLTLTLSLGGRGGGGGRLEACTTTGLRRRLIFGLRLIFEGAGVRGGFSRERRCGSNQGRESQGLLQSLSEKLQRPNLPLPNPLPCNSVLHPQLDERLFRTAYSESGPQDLGIGRIKLIDCVANQLILIVARGSLEWSGSRTYETVRCTPRFPGLVDAAGIPNMLDVSRPASDDGILGEMAVAPGSHGALAILRETSLGSPALASTFIRARASLSRSSLSWRMNRPGRSHLKRVA